jgi:hypothetical protein
VGFLVLFAIKEQLRDPWGLGFQRLASGSEQNVLDGRLPVNRRFLLLLWLETAPFFL